MLRASVLAVLLLFVALFTSLTLRPAEAKWAIKTTLEAGTHELALGNQVVIVDTSKPIDLTIQSGTDLIKGIIVALEKDQSTRVRIVLKGDPDTLLYDGEVVETVDFESATSSDETGHSEL